MYFRIHRRFINKKIQSNTILIIIRCCGSKIFLFLKNRYPQEKKYDFYDFFKYEDLLRDCFRRADKNKDGFMDMLEFKEVLDEFGYPLNENQIKKGFDNFDKNLDRRITVDGKLLRI